MSEGKRKHSGKQGGSKKRYKPNGTRIAATTIHGPGVFVTCVKGKERIAGKEIRNVFESIALDLWPVPSDGPLHADGPSNAGIDISDDEGDDGEDLEDRIRRDRVKIQSEQSTQGQPGISGRADEKLRKRLSITRILPAVSRPVSDFHQTDARKVLFASCAAPVDPVALTLAYLEEVRDKGVARTRTVQRLEPIANTCVAALPELLLLGEKVFEDGFKTSEGSESKRQTYKVVAKVRNNSKLSSLKIIEEIPRIVPPGHSVSLKQPDLTILVIVFKSIAGIGVAPRYEELKRYNVAQLVEARDLEFDLGEASRLKKSVEGKVQIDTV